MVIINQLETILVEALKTCNRNDPAYVVDKPQLRHVPELLLECYRTYAVAFDTARWPVFIVHKTFFEDESLVFRHGMNGIYSIENKKMVVDAVISVDRGDFPLSTLDQILSEGVINPEVFGRSFSFLEDQFDLYQFRNTLAFHFSEALSGGKEKRWFALICIANLFTSLNS